MAKGQLSLEFLLIFLLTMAIIAVLSGALLSQQMISESKRGESARIMQAGSAARALEAYLRSGSQMRLDFRDEGISYRVENGRFYAEHGGNLIEIGGVFYEDKDESA